MDGSADDHLLNRAGERKRYPEAFDRILTEFREDSGKVHVGRLWDLSREGACMQALAQSTIAENVIGTLRFRQVDTFEELEVIAEVCWVQSNERSCLIGLVFGSKLPDSDHFLCPYL